MLRASLLADARILPQATRGSYFFNRIGQKLTVSHTTNSLIKNGKKLPLRTCRSSLASRSTTMNLHRKKL